MHLSTRGVAREQVGKNIIPPEGKEEWLKNRLKYVDHGQNVGLFKEERIELLITFYCFVICCESAPRPKLAQF